MKVKKEIKFTKKHIIGSIVLLLAFVAIIIPTLKIYADTVVTAIIEDERTIVRTSAALSRGEDSNNVVNIDTLPTFLNKYAGSGATSVAQISSEIIQVTFASTGNIYDINIYSGPLFDVVGGSSPYIPTGYTAVEGTDLTTGFVVEDKNGNQFVWVEVPRTSEVYPTAGLGIISFTDDEYNLIEADLHTYVSTYRNGTEYLDEYYSDEATGLTSVEYYTQKKKMLKSIYKYGGFYVGRYETGIDYSEGPRTAAGDTTQTPVIKQNVYPYNYISTSQAQELSESFSTTGYSSSLMFNVQWELIMKYLESKGTSRSELITDSTSWGNYKSSTYNITNVNAKYTLDEGLTWAQALYSHTSGEIITLTTGASESFSKQNIYDLAGNLWEKSLAVWPDFPASGCNGGANYSNGDYSAYFISGTGIGSGPVWLGFRVALYKEEANTETPSYIPTGYTHVAGTDMDTGYVVQDELGNQYVWVEVPRTATVYPTAGLNITSFTADDYTNIETDLHTYTATYRNTSYTDTWSSQEATGLSESQYNIQKKKMLKSIYKNGGYYIGRYETGIENSYRAEYTDALETPVIKQHAYPYTYVRVAQAQTLSESFSSETEGYTSSLMFGIQYDLLFKYLETKGTSKTEINTDSVTWGNHENTLYNITNTNVKYIAFNNDAGYIGEWISAPYSKTESSISILTTGAHSMFSRQNISDVAGNVWEWTLESSSVSTAPSCYIGGGANWPSTRNPADSQWYDPIESDNGVMSFRVALYKDEGIGQESTTTKPTYIPAGYTHVAGTTMENGYVIEDESGNQYVWVEVPKTAAVYGAGNLNITEFTDADYGTIEDALHAYTSDYRAGTTYVDNYSEDIVEEATGLTKTEYDTQKKKMLKSIYKNEGFYVGRYETGYDYSETVRIATGDVTQTPVIQQNAYPYNWVTTSQAQELSERLSSESEGYTSSLLFGVQWDLIMKYLETKGSTQDELKTNSIAWGNYWDSIWTITNADSKYYDTSWKDGAYGKKASSAGISLSTGASETFSKQNISDLAGNIWEWTLEYTPETASPCAIRGGVAYDGGISRPANDRDPYPTNYLVGYEGFRVTLYTDEEVNLFEREMLTISGDSTASWDGTTLKIDTSSYNTDPSSQGLHAQKYLDWSWLENLISVYGVGSCSTTFTKDNSFNGVNILLQRKL